MFRRIALTLFALCLPGLALAQGWVPERPVRIILPFPPGGSTDLVARILADRASRSAPHPWLVGNRSGANGNIGMDAAAKSAPDGHTLVARPEGGPPERFAAHVQSEIARWRAVVETNKIEKLN